MSLKQPEWYNIEDQNLYNTLLNKKNEDLTKEEHDFIIDMYLQEEYHYYGEI